MNTSSIADLEKYVTCRLSPGAHWNNLAKAISEKKPSSNGKPPGKARDFQVDIVVDAETKKKSPFSFMLSKQKQAKPGRKSKGKQSTDTSAISVIMRRLEAIERKITPGQNLSSSKLEKPSLKRSIITESSVASEGKKASENKNYSDGSSGQTATKESSVTKTKTKNNPGKGSDGTSKKTAEEKEFKTSQPKYQKEMRPERDSKSSAPSSSKSPPTTQTSGREEETANSKKSKKRKIKKSKKNKGDDSEDEEDTQRRKGGSSGDAKGNNVEWGKEGDTNKDPITPKVKDSLIIKKTGGKSKKREDKVTKGLRDVYYMSVPPVYPHFNYAAETTFAAGDQAREYDATNLAESVSLSELYVPQKLKTDAKCKQLTYQPNKMDNFIEDKYKEQPIDFSLSDIYQNYLCTNSPFTKEFKDTKTIADHCKQELDFERLNLGLKTINSRKSNTRSHTETSVSTDSMGFNYHGTRDSYEQVSERIMEIIHHSHPNLKPSSKEFSYNLKPENLGYKLEVECEGNRKMNRRSGRTNMNEIGKLAKNGSNNTPMSILIKHLGQTGESKIDTSEASSSKMFSSSHLSSCNDVRSESVKRITMGLRKAVNVGLTNSYDKVFTGIKLTTSSCVSRGQLD